MSSPDGKAFRLVVVSDNPYGLIGTPGTYELVDELCKYFEVKLYCPLPNPANFIVVSSAEFQGKLVEHDRSLKGWVQSLVKDLAQDDAECVYFASGRSWMHDDAYILRELKRLNPERKIIVDLKSPPTISDVDVLRRSQRRSEYALDWIDLVLSRCVSDIRERFGHAEMRYALYPIGLSKSLVVEEVERQDRISKFVFIGSLSDKRKLDWMLDEFSLLCSEVKNQVTLDIYGDGVDKDRLVTHAKMLGIDNFVSFRGLLGHQELLQELPSYHVGLGWVPYEMYDSAPSLKSYEYLSAGLIPLLSDTRAHLKMDQRKCSVHFFSNRKSGLSRVIESLVGQNLSFYRDQLQMNKESVDNQTWAKVASDYIAPFVKNLVASEYDDKPCNFSPSPKCGVSLVHIVYFSEQDFVDWSEPLLVWLRTRVHTVKVIVRQREAWRQRVFKGGVSNPREMIELGESEVFDFMLSEDFSALIGVVSDYDDMHPYLELLDLSRVCIFETLSPERLVADAISESRSNASTRKKNVRDFAWCHSGAVFSPGGSPVSSVEKRVRSWGYELFDSEVEEVIGGPNIKGFQGSEVERERCFNACRFVCKSL
ncbi:glycosyltransferase [Gilvimarinus agarilyticus]|uniref:glycosyltransferase n=1 Tax=Gilvimarinus agarilyticus TaxID=679259 RepID=UPI0005A1FC05|nr:hypothetical protein [Gilvimarinus agarilyticus]